MATIRRWRRVKIHEVSARTVIVEYPNSVKIQFREENQGEVLFIRIDAKPFPKVNVENNRVSSKVDGKDYT